MSDINNILNERSKTHGDFLDNSRASQNIKHIMHAENADRPKRHQISLALDQCEALDMIANKIGRILGGNPDVIDHWDDIAGYATLIANRLRSE